MYVNNDPVNLIDPTGLMGEDNIGFVCQLFDCLADTMGANLRQARNNLNDSFINTGSRDRDLPSPLISPGTQLAVAAIGHGGTQMVDSTVDEIAFAGLGEAVACIFNSVRILRNANRAAEFGIANRINTQRQLTHVSGSPTQRASGFFDTPDQAQQVLDAFHSGHADILRTNKQGFLAVQFDGVTGTNVNIGADFPNQPTNTFIIKGTKKVTVVPTTPN